MHANTETTLPSTALAAFVSELTYDDIPAPVVDRVRLLLTDALASAIAGRAGGERTRMERFARAVSGTGDHVVIGAPTRLAAAGAVLVNAYQVTAVTVCDVLQVAGLHVTPQVVPPALAIAERERSSGRALLTAVAAGLEISTRLALALDPPTFRARGWHPPGVIGPYGGAAAAGRLLGLDSAAQRNAFGLAGSQAGGTFAHWGTPTIKFHQARGALSGLLAATLAHEGFASGPEGLSHPDGGLLTTYSDGGRPERLTDELGQRWELLDIAVRLWPAGTTLQAMLTGVFDLRRRHAVDPRTIESVSIELSEKGYRQGGRMSWEAPFRAHLSAPYSAGVALMDGRCWLEQYTPARLADPVLNDFIDRCVRVSQGRGLGIGGARIEVRLRDGSVLRDERLVARGDPDDLPSPGEIADKLRAASDGVLASGAAETVLGIIDRLDSLDDVGELTAALGTPRDGRSEGGSP